MTALRTCELRLAKAADAAVLASMSRDYIEQGLTWRWREPSIRSKILAPDTVVLVAELSVGGVRFVGGFAVMDFGLDVAQLDLLAVHPHLRRRTIATQLLRWLHKSARVAGCQHVVVQVRAQNHRARRFYQKHSYLEEALLPKYYENKEAAYQLKLRLFQT